MCIPCILPRHHPPRPLNILLTNGRFPVSIDLARQLKRAGHHVYTVDPMHYHVCRFSNSVKKSMHVPVPHIDAEGYVEGVKRAVLEWDIDFVVPMHEEIFYLAEALYWDEHPEKGEITGGSIRKHGKNILSGKLLAPPFEVLIMLHNKWEFSRFLKSIGLDTPLACLVKDMDDVKKLVGEGGEGGLLSDAFTKDGVALKPVYGRACSGVHHLKPGKKMEIPEGLEVNSDNHYIAQEWIKGARYCSYAIINSGEVLALGVYPVRDTIDGSSCVYFKAVDHKGIFEYVSKIASALSDIPHVWQMALDFVQTPDIPGKEGQPPVPGRLVAIECNPRATSGIHLWSRTTALALTITEPTNFKETVFPKTGSKRQLAPGMLMWKHESITTKQYLRHMKRLMGSKDVMFSSHDILPSLMQPFLLTSYYEICRERKMELPEMFQWDLTWEPTGEKLQKVRRIVKKEEKRRGVIKDEDEEDDSDEEEKGLGEDGATSINDRGKKVTTVKGGLEVIPPTSGRVGADRRDSMTV